MKRNFHGYIYEKPVFKTVVESVEDYHIQLNKLLIVYETLMMTKVMKPGINISYYNMWLNEQRLLTRVIINMRRRLERLQANNPSESRRIDPSQDAPVDMSQSELKEVKEEQPENVEQQENVEQPS